MRILLLTAVTMAGLVACLGTPAWAEEHERERPVPEEVELLKMEAERLADRGHPDQAEMLLEEAERLMEGDHGEHEEWGEHGESEIEAVHVRLRQMYAEIEELTELGRHDAAEEVAREARELEELLERDRGERRFEVEHFPEDEERHEMARRREHFRAAIENLHEAGAHDYAEGLEEQLAEMERHMHRSRGPEAHVEELIGAIQELHAEVRELRELVAHLQERVAQFSD